MFDENGFDWVQNALKMNSVVLKWTRLEKKLCILQTTPSNDGLKLVQKEIHFVFIWCPFLIQTVANLVFYCKLKDIGGQEYSTDTAKLEIMPKANVFVTSI